MLVIFSTIWDFKIFDQVYVMAQGVPDRAADTAAVAAYREGFALGHYGTGAAVAVVLFLVLLAFSMLYVRLIGKEGRHEVAARAAAGCTLRWSRSRPSRCSRSTGS